MSNVIYSQSNRIAIFKLLLIAILALVMFTPLNAYATDLAASAKQDFKDTFGKDSTFVYILMGLEIISATFLYIKTKNLAVFGGLAAVLLFTAGGFGLIG